MRLTDPRLVWPAALALEVALLVVVRDRLAQTQLALLLLLVVLGAGARAGRAIGLAVSAAAFVAFDFFFVPPYGTLAVADPREWLVLVAFLVTAGVAAQLLSAARDEALAASARADEVDRLAALGARALTAPRAREAAAAVSAAIRDTVGVGACAVWAIDAGPAGQEAGLRLLATTDGGDTAAGAPPLDAVLAARERTVVASRLDGTTHLAHPPGPSLLRALAPTDPGDLQAVSVPLTGTQTSDAIPGTGPGATAGQPPLGVLRIVASAGTGFRIAPERWRYLDALTAYAALAADRERLAAVVERADGLEEAARAKDAVLAAVSHDLRTPLTSIRALAESLRASVVGDGEAETAATIEAEADRLARLVGDLLDLSRLQAGALATAPDVVAVDDLLDVVLQRVGGALGDPTRGGRALNVVLPPGAPLLLGRFDVAQAARAVVNLIENAHKYAPSGPPIDLHVRALEAPDGPRVCLDVLDRGPGIDAAEREHVFAPFYRAPGARVDVGGAGLGLSIARGLAERQGGSLTHAPRPGGGSVFTLCLPGVHEDALGDGTFMGS